MAAASNLAATILKWFVLIIYGLFILLSLPAFAPADISPILIASNLCCSCRFFNYSEEILAASLISWSPSLSFNGDYFWAPDTTEHRLLPDLDDFFCWLPNIRSWLLPSQPLDVRRFYNVFVALGDFLASSVASVLTSPWFIAVASTPSPWFLADSFAASSSAAFLWLGWLDTTPMDSLFRTSTLMISFYVVTGPGLETSLFIAPYSSSFSCLSDMVVPSGSPLNRCLCCRIKMSA